MKLLKADNGMNIIGQGLKIILFALPALAVAVALHVYTPALVKIPVSAEILTPIGYGFLFLGFALWAPAVLQLLVGFPQGKLVTRGAYGVCRNPLYASFALFFIPGIACLTGAWIYLLVSVFVILAVQLCIRKEEEKLLQVFGAEYQAYLKSVSRILPFVKPKHESPKKSSPLLPRPSL